MNGDKRQRKRRQASIPIDKAGLLKPGDLRAAPIEPGREPALSIGAGGGKVVASVYGDALSGRDAKGAPLLVRPVTSGWCGSVTHAGQWILEFFAVLVRAAGDVADAPGAPHRTREP
jgi:hypothetical protein